MRDTYDAREDGGWETFHQWVADHHPADVERMYTADPGLPSGMRPRSSSGNSISHDFIASSDGYIARAESICTAAHTRFNDEMEAAGIDMEPSPDDDGSGLQLIPSNAEDIPAAEEVSRHVEREALIELYAVVIPEDALAESSTRPTACSRNSPRATRRPSRRRSGNRFETWNSASTSAHFR